MKNTARDNILSAILDENIKVVSFDIFDTLLLRPVIAPTDLFTLVARRAKVDNWFTQARISAESIARANRPEGVCDIHIDDIYTQMERVTGDKTLCAILKKTELDIEYEYLYPRKFAKKMYEGALAFGKEVIIISDMYLPLEFLQKVLVKNGYNGHSRLYLSNHDNASKGNGLLFNTVIDDFSKKGVSKDQIIHIGDNIHADVKMAREMGLSAFHMPKTTDVFRGKIRLKRLIDHSSLGDDKILLGFLANRMFDDPFMPFPFNKNAVYEGLPDYFGMVLFGPLMLIFSKYLAESVIENGIEKMIFCARDNYIPQKIFHMMKKAYPELADTRDGVAHLSRAVRYLCTDSIDKFLTSFTTFPDHALTVSAFIRQRLFPEGNDYGEILAIFQDNGYISENDKIADKNKVLAFVDQLYPYVFKNASKRKKVIGEYCREIFGDGAKTAVFDVGYRGTVGRFLKNEFNIDVSTYHLYNDIGLYRGSTKTKVHSFIWADFYRHPAAIRNFLVELVISSYDGSTLDIKKNGGKFEIVKSEAQEPSDALFEIQESILSFCGDFIDMFQKDLNVLSFDRVLFFNYLMWFLDTKPTEIDAGLFGKLSMFDSMSDSSYNFERWKEVWYKPVPEKPIVYAPNIPNQHLLGSARLYKIARDLKWRFREELYMRNILDPLFSNEIDIFLEGLKDIKTDGNKPVLFVGTLFGFDKGTLDYLKRIQLNFKSHSFVMLSTTDTPKQRASEMGFPVVQTPSPFLYRRFKQTGDIYIPSKIRGELAKKPYLLNIVENIYKKANGVPQKSYIKLMVYYAERFFNSVLDIINPEYVIMWNQFAELNAVYNHVCENKKVTPLYMEFGSFPGTFALDTVGQMGENPISVNPREFLKLPVDSSELREAEEILEYLKNTKLNRNIQTGTNEVSELLKKIDPERKVVFYAGQNDFESGLFPYTEKSKKYHSPTFKTSDDAALYLYEISKKNGWNFVYKPHPRTLIERGLNQYPEDMIVVKGIDINEMIDLSSVCVTILSQTAYVSLIRQKPTLLLGYLQLREKGCCYEAYEKDKIEEALKNALEYGFTEEQQRAFYKHTAQMLKYVLYDDATPRDIRFGKSTPDCAAFIEGIRE